MKPTERKKTRQHRRRRKPTNPVSAARFAAGLTQEMAAARATKIAGRNISQGTWSKWESAGTLDSRTIATVRLIAEAVDMTLDGMVAAIGGRSI